MKSEPTKEAAAPAMHRVRVRSTHGQLRIAQVPAIVAGEKARDYWLYPTGEDLVVDDRTLAIFKADPILQIEEKDEPKPVPQNLVEMPSLAAAAPKGSQAIAEQPIPRPKVIPATNPGPHFVAEKPETDDGDDDGDEGERTTTPAAAAADKKPAAADLGTDDDDKEEDPPSKLVKASVKPPKPAPVPSSPVK